MVIRLWVRIPPCYSGTGGEESTNRPAEPVNPMLSRTSPSPLIARPSPPVLPLGVLAVLDLGELGRVIRDAEFWTVEEVEWPSDGLVTESKPVSPSCTRIRGGRTGLNPLPIRHQIPNTFPTAPRTPSQSRLAGLRWPPVTCCWITWPDPWKKSSKRAFFPRR
jgi:hypothetical protein